MIVTYEGINIPDSKAVMAILEDSLDFGDSTVTQFTLEAAIAGFNCDGPYDTAQRLGLLVNNSAEDMAIEFMTYVNKIFPGSY